jgi:glycosyltransferase involved in cell wall biosynthesis
MCSEIPLKVALIDPSLFTPTYDRALMDGLCAAGDDARLYTKWLEGDELRQMGNGTVQHFYRALIGPLPRLPSSVLRGLKGIVHLRDMARLPTALRQWRPDVIHFQWMPLPAMDRMFLDRLRRIAPLFYTMHDSNPYNGNPPNLVQRLGTGWSLDLFDAVFVHTEHARHRLTLQGVPAAKIAVVPMGLLHDGLPPTATPPREAPTSPLVDVLMFGKVKPYKGVDILIRAMALLTPEQRAKCRVHVVGKPYMETQPLLDLAATSGVADCFRFDFRFVPDEEVTALLNSASIVVFPYREIDGSAVLMAALAARPAIIATRIGNFAELLTDEHSALLVPPDDHRALAEALGRAIDDQKLRQRLAEGAAAVRDDTPSWAEIGGVTHTVYEQVMSVRGRV